MTRSSVSSGAYRTVEAELTRRAPGWWDRVVDVIPELARLDQVPQSPEFHAEGDVANHTRLAVESCGDGCDPDLLWAALLHDLGKLGTTVEREGKITAHGHARASAEKALKVLDRLGMPVERTDRIIWAVRKHMFHLSWNLDDPAQMSSRHKRVVRDDRFPLLLELLRADSEASVGNPRGMKAYEFYRRVRSALTGVAESEK